MATPLAIGYLAAGSRKPRADADSALVADALADRPSIPRGVVSWPDELPAGAGAPATGIDGPARFVVPRGHSEPTLRERLEAALFGGVLAALLAGSAIAVTQAARIVIDAELTPGAQAAIAGRVPVVETRVLSTHKVIDTASRTPATAAAANGG